MNRRRKKKSFVSGLEEPPLCSGSERSNVTVHGAVRMQEALRDESSVAYWDRGGIPRVVTLGFLGNFVLMLPMGHRQLVRSYTV